MFLVQLNYPVEMLNFFGLFFPLVTFDAFPVGPFYEKMFHFAAISTDHALNDQFKIVGYSSVFVINNIGSLYLISNLQILFIILLWQLQRYKPFGGMQIQRRIDNIAKDAIWNGAIQFYVSNYLVLSVVAFIESQDLRFRVHYNSTEKFCSLLACFLMVLSLLFPLAVSLLYKLKLYNKQTFSKDEFLNDIMTSYKGSPESRIKCLNHLKTGDNLFKLFLFSKEHKQFMGKYGTLIEGLRIRHLGKTITIITPLVEIFLKLCIAVCVTRLVNWPVFTIFVFNFAIMFNLQFIIYFQPCEDKWQQAINTVNGLTYLGLNYHLFLFTNFVDSSMYPQIANSAIMLIWVNIGGNFMLTVPIMLYRSDHKLRLSYKQYKYRMGTPKLSNQIQF